VALRISTASRAARAYWWPARRRVIDNPHPQALASADRI